MAPLSNKKSPAKASKSKSTPGSGGKRSHTQQSVHTLWNDPERRREDEAFERIWAQGRASDVSVIIMEDEMAEYLLAQQRASCQPSSSSRPAATASKPKATASSSRASDTGAPSSGAIRSSSPVPQDRTRRPSPTTTRPTLSAPMPAPFQPPTHRKRDDSAPPDPAAVIVVQDDDEPLTSGEKLKGSAKKTRVYTAEEEAARQEGRNKLHSDCRQLQYANEFKNFKAYRQSIGNLRGAPNTDDHTAYVREHVLKNQKQSYAYAGNLLTVKTFQKKLRANCKDVEKVARIEKILGCRALPGVPDESMVDGRREKLLARYVMRVLQSCDGTVVDSRHADWEGTKTLVSMTLSAHCL